MDDLAQKLAGMLNDPGTMAQVQSLLGAMGGGGQGSPPFPVPQQAAPPPPQAPAVPGMGAETLGLVTKLAPLMQSLQQEDNSTRLLQALRPMLGEKRQKKLDEALRLLKLMRLLPMLRQSGLLGGLL